MQDAFWRQKAGLAWVEGLENFMAGQAIKTGNSSQDGGDFECQSEPITRQFVFHPVHAL